PDVTAPAAKASSAQPLLLLRGSSVPPEASCAYVLLLRAGQLSAEKSVGLRKTDSRWSTIGPFSSDRAFTASHSGSLANASQYAVAASRFGYARRYTRVFCACPSAGVKYPMFSMPCFSNNALV